MSSLRRLFPGIALTCKGILLFMCGAALIALFAVSPVIFGCVPSVVSETDSGAAYPAGPRHHRYTPAETLAPGDAAVVYDAGRTTVCTILSRDDALRTLADRRGAARSLLSTWRAGLFSACRLRESWFRSFPHLGLDHSSRGGSPAACRCIFAAPLQLCAEIRQIG